MLLATNTNATYFVAFLLYDGRQFFEADVKSSNPFVRMLLSSSWILLCIAWI
jgi:hypothetical protein